MQLMPTYAATLDMSLCHFRVWRDDAVDSGKVTYAVSKVLEPDFDLGPAVRISSECGHNFLVNLFWAPVLHSEIFNE
jgi:hypothetical protein